jgi:hypothetical protein
VSNVNRIMNFLPVLLFLKLISEKQDEKVACNQKKDILRPVQQDAE